MARTRDQERRGLREEIDRTRKEAARREQIAADPNEHPGEREGARRRAARDRIRVRDLQGRIDHLDHMDSLD